MTTKRVSDTFLGMTKTATRLLIEVRLGQDMEKWIRDRRTNGLSWRQISEAVELQTAVVVSHETLRGWFADRDWAKGDAA